MKFSLFAVLGAAITVLVVIASSSFQEPTALLEPVPVSGQVGDDTPLQLYYVPSASLLAQQQTLHPQLAAVAPVAPVVYYPGVRQAAPIRYVYAPVNAAYGASPYGEQIVRYIPQQQVQMVQPQQPMPTAVKAKSASDREILSNRAKEITMLRKDLNSAERREHQYEKQVKLLQKKSLLAQKQAVISKGDLAKAKNMKNWAKLEQAAASRLAKVEKAAELRVAKQNALISKLLPKVREDISRRRVLERRYAEAALAARMSSQQEQLERQQLMQDMQIAEEAEQHAQVASLTYKAMAARASQLQKRASLDRITARKDIKEARASVIGARTSAAKTLAAIRASMGGKVSKGQSQAQEENFARDARLATKEMSSKKREAKELRTVAHRLDSEAKELAMSAARKQQEIPAALEKARETEAQAQKLRAALAQAVRTSLPFNNRVQSAQELTQMTQGHAEASIHALAASEEKYSQASALLKRMQRIASAEKIKADHDTMLAEKRISSDENGIERAVNEKLEDEKKIIGLQTVLSDAKEELAELKTEANDIVGTEA